MRKLKDKHLQILETVINILDQSWLEEKANINSVIDKQLKPFVTGSKLTVEESDIIKSRILYLMDGIKIIS